MLRLIQWSILLAVCLLYGAAHAADWASGTATKEKPLAGPFVVTQVTNLGTADIPVALLDGEGNRIHSFKVPASGLLNHGEIYVPAGHSFGPTVSSGLMKTNVIGYSGYRP